MSEEVGVAVVEEVERMAVEEAAGEVLTGEGEGVVQPSRRTRVWGGVHDSKVFSQRTTEEYGSSV